MKANLERREVVLRVENGVIICTGDDAIISRFAEQIVNCKSALIALLAKPAEPLEIAGTIVRDTAPAPDDLDGWRPDAIARREAVGRGEAVVANKDSDGDLIAWATQNGLAVGIMRDGQYGNATWGSKWGNTFKIGRSGDRDEVCDKHAAKLAKSPDVLAQIGELKGRVLVCCCYPDRCHGDELARLVNAAPGAAATPTATGDLSAIAPDVRPDVTPDEAAALLSRYRRGGAILTLETVNGAHALAIEVPTRFSPAKRERAFEALEAIGLMIFRALELESMATSSNVIGAPDEVTA